MKRILLLISLLFVVILPVVSQNYLPEYIFSEPEMEITDVKVNSSKEICLIAQRYADFDKTVLIRLDETGKKLWEKTLPLAYYNIAFFDFDDAGNIRVIIGQGGVYTFYKFLNNGSLAATPQSLTDSWTYLHKISMDQSNNFYVLWGIWDSFVGEEATVLSKYNEGGVFQWTTSIKPYVRSTDMVVNNDGEVFILSSTVDPFDYLKTHLYVSKLASNRDLMDERILQTSSFTVENRPYQVCSISIDDQGKVIVINEKTPFQDFDAYTELFITDPLSVNVLAHHTIPFGATLNVRAYSNVKGRTKYIAGQARHFHQNLQLAKISEDFSYSLVTDSLQFPNYLPTALAVDASGNLSAVGGFRGDFSSRIYLDNYSSNGTSTGKFAYFDNQRFFNPRGIAVFDFENNLLTPIVGDLVKFTLCSKIQLTIASQPTNVEVCSGTDAKLQVGVSGKGVSFYWYKNNTLLGASTKFAGTDTGTLTIKQASTDDAGTYHCEVKDACGQTVKTQNATLSVIATPTLTLATPGNLARCIGAEAIFQITAAGGKNLKYQWKKGNASLIESANVVGTKTNKLTIKAVTAADAGEYYCEVTEDCRPAILVSQKATLGVQVLTAITKQPESPTSCSGSSVVLSINAAGTNLTYQWKKGTTNLLESSRLAGPKTSTLILSQLQVSDAGEYTCVVTGDCGTVQTSSKGVLAVTTDEQITGHPQSKNICSGSNTTLSITASGPTVTYQWVKSNTNLANDSKISGATTSSLTIKNAVKSDEGSYSCVITTACGNKHRSQAAQLQIGTATAITAKSPDQDLCAGALAKFSITTNVTEVDFQWKKDGSPLTDGLNVAGSRSSELYVNNISAISAGSYTCEVTSACGPSQISGAIKLAVKEKVALSEQPASQTLCELDNLVLKVTASGTAPTYQWKYGTEILTNNTRVSGATSPVLTIKDLSNLEGGYYSCEVKGCDGIVASNTVLIKVNPKPKLVLQDHIDCDNSSLQWASLVKDENNTFGDYFLFKENSTEPLPGLSSIKETGIYLIVKQTETCSDTIEWNNLCLITSAEAEPTYELAIYPNPTARWIYIEYDPAQLREFELIDSHGRQILSGNLESTGQTLLDGHGLSDGVYSVQLRTDKGRTIFQRLIVKQ